MQEKEEIKEEFLSLLKNFKNKRTLYRLHTGAGVCRDLFLKLHRCGEFLSMVVPGLYPDFFSNSQCTITNSNGRTRACLFGKIEN